MHNIECFFTTKYESCKRTQHSEAKCGRPKQTNCQWIERKINSQSLIVGRLFRFPANRDQI